jgi:uncharacterized repeat protein (TIGR01451 family)
MLILQMLQFRSLLTLGLLFVATATSSCAQEKPKRMIPGPSVKELVPESRNPDEDGISQIIFAQLFQPGTTEYRHVGAKGLKAAPPLPTGCALFKDLAYEVTTEAIVAGPNFTVFNIASATSQTDFEMLGVLHLEDDEMSPAGVSWSPVMVYPAGWDQKAFHVISKARYDGLIPDFKTKRLAALSNHFGTFAIISCQESGPLPTEPFTQISVGATSSPERVKEGQEVTHTITIENKGPKPAAEVNVKTDLNPDFDYISVSSNQGSCKRSRNSSGRVLCYLEAIPAGSKATITIEARVRRNHFWKPNQSSVESISELEMVFKENPTDFVVAENQIFTHFSTTIMKEQ